MKRTLTGFAAACMVLGSVIPVISEKPVSSIAFASASLSGARSDFNYQSISVDVAVQNYADVNQTPLHTSAIFDTGADYTIIPGTMADEMHLTNFQTVSMRGITGTAYDAYISDVNLTVDGQKFDNVPCIVVPGFDHVLIGSLFFRMEHMNIAFDYKHDTIKITPEAGK